MNRVEIADKFALMWRQSREDGGKSQSEMAKALGVSKKTIQNWEQGISCPNQLQGFMWFSVLGLQPLPYYLELLYDDEERKDLDSYLFTVIKAFPKDTKEKILYILSGEHGSSPRAVVEMVDAHLHTPLQSRYGTAWTVINNYDMSERTNVLINMDKAVPDMDFLKLATQKAMESIIKKDTMYTILEGDK